MTDLQDTIDTYMEAYSEADETRCRELVERVWAEDGHLIDPPLTGSGRDEIRSMAAAVQGAYPGHAFRRASAIDEHHSFARYQWELVAPDGTVALNGIDFAEVDEDGRLRRVVGFLGDIPAEPET